MRISDWSSDVCSSDLNEQGKPKIARLRLIRHDHLRQQKAVCNRSQQRPECKTEEPARLPLLSRTQAYFERHRTQQDAQGQHTQGQVKLSHDTAQTGRASSRERVCQYV